MSSLIVFLVVFPLVVGGLLLGVRNGNLRNVIVVLAGLVVAGASIVTAVTFGNGSAVFFDLPNGLTLGRSLLVVEIAIAALVVVVGIQNRRILAPILVLGQLASSLIRYAFKESSDHVL